MTTARKAVKNVVIVAGILVLLFLLSQLFLRPAQPVRDLVFGDLGRVRSSLTNRTETPFPPPILTPTNTTLSVPPVGSFPNAVSNYNGSLTPEPQPTNDPLSNAVARAMEAPPVIRPPETSLPPLVAPPGTGPTNFPGIAIAASGPPQSQAPAPALSPAPAPVEPYIPRTSEPGSKESTAALLAATEGYTPPEPTDMGARPTSSLLGGANQSASNAVPVVSARSPNVANVTNFSFVIDQSLSMARDGKTARAQSEVLKMLEMAGPENTFYVLLFHSGGYEGMPGLGPVPATPDNIRAMSSWLFSAGHRFGSDPSKGMRRALHMVPAPNVVWLISGGGFSRGAVQAIREANQGINAQVNIIDLDNSESEPAMRQVAEENRGTFRFISIP